MEGVGTQQNIQHGQASSVNLRRTTTWVMVQYHGPKIRETLTKTFLKRGKTIVTKRKCGLSK